MAVRRTAVSSGSPAGYDAVYTSLSAWESAEETDLVADGDTHIMDLYKKDPIGSWGALTTLGWTTGPNNYVTIRAPASERWDGIDPLSGVYAGGSWLLEPYTQVEYITLETGYFVPDGTAGEASGTSLLGCIAYNGASQNPFRALAYVNSCLAIGGTKEHFYICAYMNNCVSINSPGRAFVSGTAKNCISYGSTNAGFSQSAGGSDYNASDDTSSPGSNSVDNITSAEFSDYAGGDYSLASDSQLILAGTNLYSTFTQDIVSVEWPSAGDWDIGAFHYAGEGSTVKVNPVMVGTSF